MVKSLNAKKAVVIVVPKYPKMVIRKDSAKETKPIEKGNMNMKEAEEHAEIKDGKLKHKGTYEIISPEDTGLLRSNESGIVLGKPSGRHALKSEPVKLGYDAVGKVLDDVFCRSNGDPEQKKHVSDADLIEFWSFRDLQVVCGSFPSMAAVTLISADGEKHVACSSGLGAVNSTYKAIDLIVKVPVTLLKYSTKSVKKGIDAPATTRVLIRGDIKSTHSQTGESIKPTFSGTGTSTDITVSSARAYINALNNMLSFMNSDSKAVSESSRVS